MSDLDILEFGERAAKMLDHEARLGTIAMLWAYSQILRIIGIDFGS